MARKAAYLLIILKLQLWCVVAHSGPSILQSIPVKTTTNQQITLDKISTNRAVYLKIWASWCQPCRKQMPHFQKSHEKYGKNIDFIAVNIGINESMSAIADIRQTFSLTMPIVIDHTGQLARLFDLKGTPLNILIDKSGNIIYRSHEISKTLNNALRLLSDNITPDLPSIKIARNDNNSPVNNRPVNINAKTDQPTVLFFTSTWCDWYLEKTRPAMSANCIHSQKIMNELYRNNPDLNWTGALSPLWTTEKELIEYQKKYRIKYPLYIDDKNRLFARYKIKKYPTLIVLKNSEVELKLEDFSDLKSITEKFSKF
ncbi:MAG TPA: redoxin domain-containing protein [Gammaproteobacteria bacterium]|nr:redoxin domain-containing protein [Gammaproteobacteria bacterium]